MFDELEELSGDYCQSNWLTEEDYEDYYRELDPNDEDYSLDEEDLLPW